MTSKTPLIDLWNTKPTGTYLFKDRPGDGYPSIKMDKFLWDLRVQVDKDQKKVQDHLKKLPSQFISMDLFYNFGGGSMKFREDFVFNDWFEELITLVEAEE